MVLESIEIVNGIAMIILDAISITLGLIIASKYVKYKNPAFIYVGFTIICLSSPWWPGAISYILLSLNMLGLTSQVYFIIGNVFIPAAVVTWLAAFTKFIYPNKQKIVVILALITGIIFLIFFFYYLEADITMIGILTGTNQFDVQYNTVVVIYYTAILVILLITGYMFAKQSMKSDNPEIRLKGKLLLLAFILYVVGALLDSFLLLDIGTLILFRGLQLAAAFIFYTGFILPNWMKKLLIKK